MEETRTLTGRMHPATSYEAALSVEGTVANLRERVFRALEQAGAVGLTADEIEVQTGIKGSTTRPRLLELQDEGRVERTLAMRKTRSGRNAYVYVVREQAEAVSAGDGVRRDANGALVLDLEW